jgi:uncharacterized protein YndB with AHSA1/START domain
MTTPPVTELRLSRDFDAPAGTLFALFTDPVQLAVWFGPAAFTVPFESVAVELREGGDWSLSMVETATGLAYPIRGTVVSFTAGERLELRLDADDGSDLGLREVGLRIRFRDGGVDLEQGPFTEEQRDSTAQGWELSFQKIDAVLAAHSGCRPRSRSAAAPAASARTGSSASGRMTRTPPWRAPSNSAAPCGRGRRTRPSAAWRSSPTRRARRSGS